MTAKEKLRLYADYKGITPRKLSLELEQSDSYLRTNGSVYSDVIPKVRNKLRDFNMDWFLYDEGNMILENDFKVSEPQESYGIDFKIKELLKAKDQIIASKDETILSQNKTIKNMELLIDCLEKEIEKPNSKAS